MARLSVFLTLLTALPLVESNDFSRDQQHAAITATVRINARMPDHQGSGVIVRQSGAFVYLLTAAHVVEGADTVQVSTFSAKSYPQPDKVYPSVQVIARNKDADLALLRLATRDPMPGVRRIRVGDGELPRAEFPVLTCGVQGTDPPTCWIDAVSGQKRIRRPGGETSLVWEVKRPPARGRSGGPLIDRTGQVIGIGSGIGDGKGYYAHQDEIHRFLKENNQLNLLEQD